MIGLEQRIVDLLANPRAASGDVEMMLRECEDAIMSAGMEAKRQKEASLDPALAPDAKAALDAAQLAEISAERLKRSKVRLEQLLRQMLDAEYRQKWAARYKIAETRRNKASERFTRLEALFAEIVETFKEAEQADKLVSEVNGSAPASVSTRLRPTEVHARGLVDGFTRAQPSIMKEMLLFDFHSTQIWPVKQPIDPTIFMMDGRRHAFDCGPEWWRAGQAAAEAKYEEQQKALKEAAAARDAFYGRRPPA
jgi:hypothetical protein